MTSRDTDTEQLVDRAAVGDRSAMEQLMSRHRDRLRQMVSVRMDRRLAARVDPSDVVQETLAEAARKLPVFVRERSLPFYLWLRELAWEHLVTLYRRHVRAQRRAVTREEPAELKLSDESTIVLAYQLAPSGTSPSEQMMRSELRQRVRLALNRLAPKDREILVMRHLEQLEVGEIAAILGITEGAVMMRRLRAFERLRRLLNDGGSEPSR